MIASDGPKIGTSMNTLNSGTAARATPRPIRAVATGRPMATTDPKVRSRTTTAAANPIASRAPPSAVAANCTAWPPTSTWRVSVFACSAVASISSTVPAGMSSVDAANLTRANAILRSWEIWNPPSGP
jgi:hypothetical protein